MKRRLSLLDIYIVVSSVSSCTAWITQWSVSCTPSMYYHGNNPCDRHIYFLKHLLRYVKYSKKDRLKFKIHPGPWDIETMTPLMQLHYQCDADLGGNMDNDHSQTSYLDQVISYAGARLTRVAFRPPQQSQRLKLSTIPSKLKSLPIVVSSI
jgi:hypothetical protein